MTIRFIEESGGRRFAVMPVDEYERLLEAAEMLDDIRAYDAARNRPQDFVPADMVDAILDGGNPIRLWRRHRGMTQAALARKVGIATPYLSQLETGKREPSLAVLRRLARALAVDLDDLTPVAQA